MALAIGEEALAQARVRHVIDLANDMARRRRLRVCTSRGKRLLGRRPSERSLAGKSLYSGDDLERLIR